jgi:hypothetical protein
VLSFCEESGERDEMDTRIGTGTSV